MCLLINAMTSTAENEDLFVYISLKWSRVKKNNIFNITLWPNLSSLHCISWKIGTMPHYTAPVSLIKAPSSW